MFQTSIALFSMALVLDTLATTPLQFVFAAHPSRRGQRHARAPIDGHPAAELLPLRHGRIGAVWSVTSLLGILSGPAIGGWVSEYWGWRSLFYLSLPWRSSSSSRWRCTCARRSSKTISRFDFFGLATFTMGIAGLQLMLDRGERMEWFASTEIWVEAIVSLTGFYFFAVHVLTRDSHFLHKALFKDRNFGLSAIMFFVFGFTCCCRHWR